MRLKFTPSPRGIRRAEGSPWRCEPVSITETQFFLFSRVSPLFPFSRVSRSFPFPRVSRTFPFPRVSPLYGGLSVTNNKVLGQKTNPTLQSGVKEYHGSRALARKPHASRKLESITETQFFPFPRVSLFYRGLSVTNNKVLGQKTNPTLQSGVKEYYKKRALSRKLPAN